MAIIRTIRANNRFRDTQKAIFAQLNYHVSDKIVLTMGARYTHVEQRNSGQQFQGTLSPTDSTPVCQTVNYWRGNPGLDPADCRVTVQQTFNPLTWNVSLNYQALRGTMLYVSAGRGFQNGGNNFQIPIPAYQLFRPETVNNYEAGVKSDWRLADRPIRTNVAVFYNRYRNQQRYINDTLPDGTNFGGTFNAADSTTYGAETEINYLPTTGLSLSFFYSYIHAKYDQFLTPPLGIHGGQDLSDGRITSTPKHTLGSTISYELPVDSRDGKIRLSATDYYRSSTYSDDIEQTAFTRLPGYNQLNLRADIIRLPPFDVAVWTNNVCNKFYAINKQDQRDGLGYATIVPGPPRTYGVEATFKF